MKMQLKPAALATLALLSGLAVGAQADVRKTYIVQLKDEPAASYQGGVSGYSATQAQPGQSFKFHTPAVQAYVQYLGSTQASVTSTISAPVLYNYTNVFNGFAAQLTDVEVQSLLANPKVVAVVQDEPLKVQTISTPRFLGLSGDASGGGVWNLKDANGVALKGEDLVIGVVDLGIWPENPAFFDRTDPTTGSPVKSGGTLAYGPPPASFKGSCVTTTDMSFVASRDCNNKLVGAKFFNATFNTQSKTLDPTEFANSPRDSTSSSIDNLTGHGGHGDHTASTAAGNALNPQILYGGLSVGMGSGMAPRARIAAYKVCWTYVDPTNADGSGAGNTCYAGDDMAGIDQAVADGVNAINFSIGSTSTSPISSIIEQAFYRASLAGIFVAASAGNSGTTSAGVPVNSTFDHPSPWLTTVAASNHDRGQQGSITLGDARTFVGVTTNSVALPLTTTIRAEDAGLGGGASNLCFSDAAAAAAASPAQVLLDPAKVKDKIVICTRGINARVDKSVAVKNAGGAGMILVDNGSGLVTEVHSVPTVMVNAADGATIKTYAQGTSPTSSLSAFTLISQPAPIIAAFSSRGPNLVDGNILKPDLTAPGVDVIAQYTPSLSKAQHDAVAAGTFTPPPGYNMISGTSMASPHVAGISLLIKQAHPNWSPAAIKSALMTTAYNTLSDGRLSTDPTAGQLPWAQGAGHINPAAALDPGLVYDAGKADYLRYQCLVNKTGVSASDCATSGALDATYNLNLASITVAAMTGGVTVKRSVTNVGSAAATYTGLIMVPGFNTTLTPTSLVLQPGETKSFTVTITASTAIKNAWNFGKLTWTDGTHKVISPVQLQVGEPISAPAEQTATTLSGSRLYAVKTGFSGKMTALKGGLTDATLSATSRALKPAAVSSATLISACKSGAGAANIQTYSVPIVAGTLVARFAVRQQDTDRSTDDFDMAVVFPNGTTSMYSGNDGSNEAIQIVTPVAGTYKVCVLAFANGLTGTHTTDTMTHQLSSWVVKAGDMGAAGNKFNLALPASVYTGSAGTVGVSWSGLVSGGRYLGAVGLVDQNGVTSAAATTVMRIETSSGNVPLAATPAGMTVGIHANSVND